MVQASRLTDSLPALSMMDNLLIVKSMDNLEVWFG